MLPFPILNAIPKMFLLYQYFTGPKECNQHQILHMVSFQPYYSVDAFKIQQALCFLMKPLTQFTPQLGAIVLEWSPYLKIMSESLLMANKTHEKVCLHINELYVEDFYEEL